MLGTPEQAPLSVTFAVGAHDPRRGKRAALLPQAEAEALLSRALQQRVRPWAVLTPAQTRWRPLDPADGDPFLRRAARRYLDGRSRRALVLTVPRPEPLPAAPLVCLQLPPQWAPALPGVAPQAAFCAVALSLPRGAEAASFSAGSLPGPPKLYVVVRVQLLSKLGETAVYGLRHVLLVREEEC
jgi:hypothetical protein